MDNVKTSWWQSHKPTTRRLIQLYSVLLHNAHLKGFISGQIYQGRAKYACTPGFNCYSCPSAAGACPLGSIQNALASTGHSAGWYVLGILLLFGVVLGRTICGWLCPLGAIQNALASTGHSAGWYVLGIILLFGVVLGRTVCGWLCPWGCSRSCFTKSPRRRSEGAASPGRFPG